MKTLTTIMLVVYATLSATGQGTLVFDQESSADEAYPAGGVAIQFYGFVGQSFTPSLSTVGFVRFKLYDGLRNNSQGATLVTTLRSNSVNGTVLGTSSALVLADNFSGSANFLFPSPVAVVPGTTYFFQTVVQSGDNWGMTALGDTYSTGILYGGLQPFTGNDLWFREGIVVPEPGVGSILVISSVWVALVRRNCQKK